MSEGYRLATRVFSVLIIGFGLTMVIVSLGKGGGALSVGVVLGVAFIAFGIGRLYLAMRS